MARNILIFSDGTGQVGGYEFDEDRTNVYKLYRATRVGPDAVTTKKDLHCLNLGWRRETSSRCGAKEISRHFLQSKAWVGGGH